MAPGKIEEESSKKGTGRTPALTLEVEAQGRPNCYLTNRYNRRKIWLQDPHSRVTLGNFPNKHRSILEEFSSCPTAYISCELRD